MDRIIKFSALSLFLLFVNTSLFAQALYRVNSLYEDTLRVVIIWNDPGGIDACHPNTVPVGEKTKDFILEALDIGQIPNIRVLLNGERDRATWEQVIGLWGGDTLPHVIVHSNAGWSTGNPGWNGEELEEIFNEAVSRKIGIVSVGDDAADLASNTFSFENVENVPEPMGDARTIDSLWIGLLRENDNNLKVFNHDGSLVYPGANGIISNTVDSILDNNDILLFNPFGPGRCQADADEYVVRYPQWTTMLGYQQGFRSDTLVQPDNRQLNVLVAIQDTTDEDVIRRAVAVSFQPQFLRNPQAAQQVVYDAIMFASLAHTLFVVHRIEIALEGDTLTAGDTATVRAVIFDQRDSLLTDLLPLVSWSLVDPEPGDLLLDSTGETARFTGTMAWRSITIQGCLQDPRTGNLHCAITDVYIRPAAPHHINIQTTSEVTQLNQDTPVPVVTLGDDNAEAVLYAVVRDIFENYVRYSDPLTTEWVSQIDTIASVQGTDAQMWIGNVSRTGNGETQIEAREGTLIPGTAIVTSHLSRPTVIEIITDKDTIEAGEIATLISVIYDQHGVVLPDLPALVNWSIIGTLDGDGLSVTTGETTEFTATRAWREVIIMACLEDPATQNVICTTATIFINPGAPHHINIQTVSEITAFNDDTPVPAITLNNDNPEALLYAVVRDSFGNFVRYSDPNTTTWSSQDETIARVQGTNGTMWIGTVSRAGTGETQVEALEGSLIPGVANITSYLSIPTVIEIITNSDSVKAGDTTPLTAVVYDQNGNVMTTIVDLVNWNIVESRRGDSISVTTGKTTNFSATIAWRTVTVEACLIDQGIEICTTATIYVGPADPDRINVQRTPVVTQDMLNQDSPPLHINLGNDTTSVTLYAVVRDRFGNYVRVANPSTTEWVSTDESIAITETNPDSAWVGTIYRSGGGTTIIEAREGTLTPGSVTVTCEELSLLRTATTRDSDGNGLLDKIELVFLEPVELVSDARLQEMLSIIYGTNREFQITGLTSSSSGSKDSVWFIELREDSTWGLQTDWEPVMDGRIPIIISGRTLYHNFDRVNISDGAGAVIRRVIYYPPDITGKTDTLRITLSEPVNRNELLSLTAAELFFIYNQNSEVNLNDVFDGAQIILAGDGDYITDIMIVRHGSIVTTSKIEAYKDLLQLAGSVADKAGVYPPDPSLGRKVRIELGGANVITVVATPNPLRPDVKLPPEFYTFYSTVLADKPQNEGMVISVFSRKPLRRTSDDSYGTAVIYDATGNVVAKNLAVKETPSSQDFGIYWNGTNRNGRKVGPGAYLCVVTCIDIDGRTHIQKINLGVVK